MMALNVRLHQTGNNMHVYYIQRRCRRLILPLPPILTSEVRQSTG